MRRSITYTEPAAITAGKVGNWKFIYTPANAVPKGTILRFEMHSNGKPLDWQIPETSLKKKSNLIWLETKKKKTISGSLQKSSSTGEPYFEFILPHETEPGDLITIHLGTQEKDVEKYGNRAQKNIQRKRAFKLLIDSKGKGDFQSENFHLDVRGGKLHHLRIIAPSLVTRNKRFDVIVRFEDAFGNLTSNAPEDTLIDLSYEHLRENLNWKLFVPETGFIALPNLYFNEPEVYRIQLKNLKTKEVFFSPPIKCLDESNTSIFWGLLHGESERHDSIENIESCLRYFRDDKALHFFCSSCFDQERETSNDQWKHIQQYIHEFNEEDRFVAMIGSQWVGDQKEEGLRHFIHAKEARSMIRKKDTKTNCLKKIYKTFQPKDLLSIPSFTMGNASTFNFKEHDPEFEKVAEIYNAWGSSECTSAEGNLRPIKGGKKTVVSETPEGSLRKALNQNCRFGFVAGGLDDRGVYADFYHSDQNQYSAGLTAVLSKDHSRASIFDALHKRSCYATTGARMIVGFKIAGKGIGSETDTFEKPGLLYNRHITGYVIGTTLIQKVELIRNGKVFHTFEPKTERFDFTYDDTDLLDKIAIQPNKEKPPFAYYYLRAIQEDHHVAWSSPIWIDLQTSKPTTLKKRKKA